MKKLFLSLLTLATASTIAGFAGCTAGQTGGGDNTTENNAGVTEIQQHDLPEDQTTDNEYEIMPPRMPMNVNEPMLPPEGRIFNYFGRHPEILHDSPANDKTKDGSVEGPAAKVPKKRNKIKDDMVTPDGNLTPDTEDVNAKPQKLTEDNGDSQPDVKETEPKVKNDKRKRRRRKPQEKNDKFNLVPEK